MKKIWLLALGLIMVISIVALVGCSEGSAGPIEIQGVNLSNQQEGIFVSGQGKVTAVPDIATVSLGIEAQDTSVAQAQSKATQAMNDVMTALTGNGVARKDIQTQNFSIQQITRWDDKTQQQIVIGYRVDNTVSAKIRNIDKAGAIIDAVAQAGGDFTRVNSISFSVDDPTSYYTQAREKAMNDAKAKASQLANLAGVTLGKPTYISESGVQIPSPIYSGREAVAADSTPISPGELDVTLSVQVTYSILK